jgi:6-phosphofructo-2-kinase
MSPLDSRDRRQHKTRIFNVGNRRRLAQHNEDVDHQTEHDARFFDPNNAEYTATREQLAMDTLEELLHWLLAENGSVGILGTQSSLLSMLIAI